MAKLALANPKASLKAGLTRSHTDSEIVAFTDVISEGGEGGSNGAGGERSKTWSAPSVLLRAKSMQAISPIKAARRLMVQPPADIEQGGLRLSPKKLGGKLLDVSRGQQKSQKADALAEEAEDVTEAVVGSRFGANMKLVIVHAISAAEDGCEFEHFFSTTPPDLVQAAVLLLTTYYCLLTVHCTALYRTYVFTYYRPRVGGHILPDRRPSVRLDRLPQGVQPSPTMPPPLTPLSVCPALLPLCCRAKVSVSLILESFGRNHSGISKPAATKTKQGVIDYKDRVGSHEWRPVGSWPLQLQFDMANVLRRLRQGAITIVSM